MNIQGNRFTTKINRIGNKSFESLVQYFDEQNKDKRNSGPNCPYWTLKEVASQIIPLVEGKRALIVGYRCSKILNNTLVLEACFYLNYLFECVN